MVQPTSVTVTAVPAASVPPAAANTMDVLPGAPGVSVTPAVDTWAVGVAEVAKRSDGLFSVTLDGPPPPALGVKVNVASTPALAATRSPAAS
jgi:hypothetical protein